jgi:SulP family sulfate permease
MLRAGRDAVAARLVQGRSSAAPARRTRVATGDLVAGISVALVLVPQSLAYAQLAGMPAYRGLYAAVLPPLAAAFFASSPYLQTGPVALTSLLAFGVLSAHAVPGSDEYVELGILLALVVGVVRIAVGVLRAGVLAYLVSQPMLLGFLPAAAILIVASQLPAALGAEPPEGGILRSAGWALGHPSAWELAAVLLALATILLVVVGRQVHRLFPGVLVAVAAGLAYSLAAGYDGATIGPIPEKILDPSFDLPWGELPSLLLGGLIIAIVGFVEPSTIARTFAAQERRPWDSDREFVGQGAANIASALGGGFPVGGSFSRSSLNRSAGAVTRWSGAITGLAVLVFLPFAGSLSELPLAVLAGIVIAAVAPLVRPLPLLRLARYSKPQFLVAATTFGLTLALSPHVERAVLAGIVLSVAVHLWRELRLEIPGWLDGETLHMRPRGVLYFGTEQRIEDAFLRLVAEHPQATRLAVHLDGLGRIDLTGALALRAVLHDARDAGFEVEILDVRPRWRPLVERVIESEQDPLGRWRA